ncbi:alpha-amylase family glycosyl hydrolase [Thermodesulfovibrionales bacterium]|nr:alpha-amylase family glycosyl hydrolase [Thermodesulfovibrionales bacterium]
MRIGANYLGDGRCEFVVWAPLIRGISLKMVSPPERIIPMEQDRDGHWKRTVSEVYPKMSYLYRLEDEVERPDPASHFQPEGIHGPSQVVDHKEFNWEDEEWKGIQLSEMIIYELHVGTFTPEGTFDAAAARIADLKEMGVSAIEIMPVAQFPGGRNWGYDGTYPFAVQDSYGGPDGLKRLVNESHKRGVAVILDVVYNHLGPEGNYLWNYGPYFTAKYRTQWGEAINFDGAYSNGVRNFFIENALHWFENYHIDALRLDAVHSIVDVSARPFLQGLAERVKKFSEEKGRDFYLIAESDLNDSRVIKRQELGGYGIDAQWCDDFHHAIHTAVTAENRGYYIDFGSIHHLVTSLRDGFVYSGQYSKHRKMNHGNSSKEIPAEQFIIFFPKP